MDRSRTLDTGDPQKVVSDAVQNGDAAIAEAIKDGHISVRGSASDSILNEIDGSDPRFDVAGAIADHRAIVHRSDLVAEKDGAGRTTSEPDPGSTSALDAAFAEWDSGSGHDGFPAPVDTDADAPDPADAAADEETRPG